MFEDRKTKLFLLTLAVVLTVGLGIKAFVGTRTPLPEQQSPLVTGGSAQEIVVYVTGAVSKQGLVKLPAGSRLADALNAAGQEPDADIGSLNLAEKLKDGQKVVIPKIASSNAEGVTTGPGIPGVNTSGNTTAAGAKSADGKVNINTANAQELDTLPGIGPAMAERIIAYRTQNGPFTSTEELKEVPGIGDKKYADLLPLIRIN